MISNLDWRDALKLTLPVAMGYIPAGVAYGVLFVAAGLPAWAAVFSSMILYAGAAQYASIPLLASGVGFFTHASNTFAINLRMAFYGIPLIQHLPTHPIARLICLFCLTDETFSLLTTLTPQQRTKLILPISVLNWSYWLIGTILGLVIGAGLNDLVPNLDFALVCLFVILGYEQFKNTNALYPIVFASIAFVLAMWLMPSWVLLGAIVLSSLLIIARYFWQTHSTHS
ncbi:branched chain amino acid efflux pump, LivE family, large subunit [Moraxella macacae 0408225]|uniref:Branched chain amino acid efflux pump, LivE family, large subunit n=1 Tax=Moraxella macacae 0408225 TaxID=1230338 RepID=L2F5Q7_9GAMM|nr:AzlC family ABC transporter permease [Moraxella macacae]ELA08399.1 branched chain amino acid efflux pump, LivE family, large subunit [Moraxella macacae 0408225]